MKRIVYRVVFVKSRDRWEVRRGKTAQDIHETKSEAIFWGRWMARMTHQNGHGDVQLVVHNKNGHIAFENTYGHDPKRYKS